MRRRRLLRPALVGLLVLTGFVPAHAGAGAAVCIWGGTETAPTGTFTVHPGLHTALTPTPIHFEVQGDLAGASPRCTGNMTLDGTLIPGASCTLTIGYAEVGGVPGVVSDTNVGVTFAIRGPLFGPDGSIAGSHDD